MTANDIIKAALRKLLIIPSGGTPTSNQYTDGLEVLNNLVESWSAQYNLVYEDTLEELTIPSGTQSITIGSAGTLVTARPLKINIASLKDSSTEYGELDIYDERDYATFNKSTVSLPSGVYYRNTYPNGTIYFNCTTDKEYTLVLTSLKELSTFPDGTTAVSLPPYYERAFKTNLTIELADEFGAGNRVTQAMVLLADESKNAIIGKSVSPVEARIEIGAGRAYNINEG